MLVFTLFYGAFAARLPALWIRRAASARPGRSPAGH